MANLLHFVQDLLEGDAERQAYRADRPGYVRDHGPAELTGEDVVEALAVVRDLVAPDVGVRIEGAAGSAPPAAPEPGETPLEAALRVLDHYVDAMAPEDAQPSGNLT